MWLGVGPSAHDLLDFILGHLVFPQCDIVAEKSSAELVGDQDCNCGSPCHSKDHIEGDAQSPYSAELIVTAQMVEGSSTDSGAIKSHSKRDVARVLLL